MEQLLVSINTSVINLSEKADNIIYGLNTIISLLDKIVQNIEQKNTIEQINNTNNIGNVGIGAIDKLIENADKIKDLPFADIKDLIVTISEVDPTKVEQASQSLAQAINTISEPLMDKDTEQLKQKAFSFSDIASLVFTTTVTTVIPTIMSVVALSFLSPDIELTTALMFGIISLSVNMMAGMIAKLKQSGMEPLELLGFIPFFTLVPPAIVGGMALTIPIFAMMTGPFNLPPMEWVLGSALALVSYSLALVPLMYSTAPFTQTFGDWLGLSIGLPLMITGIASGLLATMYLFTMLPTEPINVPDPSVVFDIASSLFLFSLGVLPLLLISSVLTGFIQIKPTGITTAGGGFKGLWQMILTSFTIAGTFMGLIFAVSSGLVLTSHILSLYNQDATNIGIDVVANLGQAISSFIRNTWEIATYSAILGLASGTIGAFTGGTMGFIFSLLSIFTSSLGYIAMITAISSAIVISSHIFSLMSEFSLPFDLIIQSGHVIGQYASAIEPFMPIIMAMGIGAGAVSLVPGLGPVLGFVFAILSALGVGLGILASIISIASGIVITIEIFKALPDASVMSGMLESVSMAGQLIGTFLGKLGGSLIKASIDDVKVSLLALNEVIVQLDVEKWSLAGQGLYNLAMGIKTLIGTQMPSIGQAIGTGITTMVQAGVGFVEGLLSEEKSVGEAISDRLDQQFLSPLEKVDKAVRQWDIDQTTKVAGAITLLSSATSSFKVNNDFVIFSQTMETINSVAKSDAVLKFISQMILLMDSINDLEYELVYALRDTMDQIKQIISQPIEQVEQNIGLLVDKINKLSEAIKDIEGTKLDIELGEDTKQLLTTIIQTLEEQSEILITLKKRMIT